jgi:hypothetical protein
MRDQILGTCFEPFDGHFASGEPANNKLNLEKLTDHEPLRHAVALALGRFVAGHNPDFVTAVPDGANWLAEDIAGLYALDFVKLRKDPAAKAIDFATPADQDRCLQAESGVLVEDVFNSFTNTRKILGNFALHGRIQAAYAVWDRGYDNQRPPLSVPHKALFKFAIPPMLPDSSSLWRFTK